MTTYERMLAERRRESKATARAILDVCTAESREMSSTESARFDSIIKDLDSQDAAGAMVGERRTALAASESVFRDLADTPRDLRAGFKTPENREIEDKFRSMILERNPAPIMVKSACPRSYYQPGVETRALGKAAGAVNMTSVGFYDKILLNLVESSAVLRAGATVITTENGEDLRIPRQTAYSAAGIVAEGATIPEADPTLTSVTLGAFGYKVLITVSNELVEDVGFDLSSYLATETGVALGNALGSDLINGSGSGAPRGVLLDAVLGVTGPVGTSTSLGAQGTAGQGTDLLNSLWGSLAEPYTRAKAAAFLLRTATLTNVRNLKGTTGDLVGNQYLSQAPAPFLVDPYVAAQAANAKSVLFGDWSRVMVRIVNGIRFEQSREAAFSTDQTVFRAVLRADGALADTTGAIKWFANSAT
jgi:HK97 family phage major capsid protein